MNHKLSKLNKIIIIYIIAAIALLSNVNATTSQTDNENTNNDLASLSITDYQISPEFNKNTRNYYVAIPTTISSVEVNAQAESAKATVKITGNTQLTKTENTIQIVVTSAKGRKKTYKIIATKQKENTLKLQSLEIKGATFSPAFDSSKYYYTAEMKINDDSKDITVEAVANNANAKIEVIGNKGIKAGENLVSVIVSDSRETTVYEILINATVEKTIISNVENNDKIQQVKNGVLEFFKDENKVMSTFTCYDGETLEIPSVYAGENGFEGWYTSDNQKAINTMRVRGSIELTAKWSVPHKVEQDITDNNRDNNGDNNITVTPSVKKAVIKSAVKKKGKAVIKIKKIAKVSGYQLNVARNVKFKKVKTINTKKTTVIVKKIKSNKKYYVRVRAYKVVNGTKVYGKWSKVRKVK